MRISVQADEGDEVSICADFISVEQAIVTLEIENTFYNSQTELEFGNTINRQGTRVGTCTFVRSQCHRNCEGIHESHLIRPRTSAQFWYRPRCPLRRNQPDNISGKSITLPEMAGAVGRGAPENEQPPAPRR